MNLAFGQPYLNSLNRSFINYINQYEPLLNIYYITFFSGIIQLYFKKTTELVEKEWHQEAVPGRNKSLHRWSPQDSYPLTWQVLAASLYLARIKILAVVWDRPHDKNGLENYREWMCDRLNHPPLLSVIKPTNSEAGDKRPVTTPN